MNSKISQNELENSAIGSWGGYIYQGLCGIYHALVLIESDKDSYTHYSLSLDSFEDFSILDNMKKITSLHQCKNEKNIKNYDNEQEKMHKKKSFLNESGLITKNCILYLHNVHDISLKYGIQLYKYHNGKNTCDPGELYALLEEKVESIKNDIDSSSLIVAKLISLVEKKVLEVQQRYFDSKGCRLRDIARKCAFIPFSDILSAIYDPSFLSIDKKLFLSYIRLRYTSYISQLINNSIIDGKSVDLDKINNFIMQFNRLSEDKCWSFLQRINPKECIGIDMNTLTNICGKERIESLFFQLNELTPLKNDTFDWHTEKSQQTPTTLFGNKRSISNICKDIYAQSPNLDFLWEYSWLVGDIDEKVDSILDKSNVITVVSSVNPKSIFSIKKVGILTIDNKKNGNFE